MKFDKLNSAEREGRFCFRKGYFGYLNSNITYKNVYSGVSVPVLRKEDMMKEAVWASLEEFVCSNFQCSYLEKVHFNPKPIKVNSHADQWRAQEKQDHPEQD